MIKRSNAIVLLVAGRRFSPWVVLEHSGRRSGRVYRTPLTTFPVGDGFVFMLRYGTGVDWCRNVMASGHAVLTRKGKSLPLYRPEIIPVGETVLAALPRPFRFMAPDGGGLGKGGDVTLYYDGKPVGTGRVKRTEPLIYSADEACDVGSDTGSPSSPDYGPTDNKFNGEIDWVQIDIGADSQDHLIKPEDRLTIAMARQ